MRRSIMRWCHVGERGLSPRVVGALALLSLLAGCYTAVEGLWILDLAPLPDLSGDCAPSDTGGPDGADIEVSGDHFVQAEIHVHGGVATVIYDEDTVLQGEMSEGTLSVSSTQKTEFGGAEFGFEQEHSITLEAERSGSTLEGTFESRDIEVTGEERYECTYTYSFEGTKASSRP